MKYGPKKDRSPLTRLLRFEQKQIKLQKSLAGDGKRYQYVNNTTGDLGLPKPAEDGRRSIPKDGKFIGDGYFLYLVPQCLRIVEDLNMEKLITEQPPVVTTEGTTEYVKQDRRQKLNESKPVKDEDVLLNEDPIGGVVILE